MYLNIFRICALNYSAPGLAWEAALKKTKVKIDLLTNIICSIMCSIIYPLYSIIYSLCSIMCSVITNYYIFKKNTLLLADIIKYFSNMFLELYGFNPVHFLTAQGLEWEATLKKTKVKLDLLTNMDVLLMVEKCIRGGKCYAIHR